MKLQLDELAIAKDVHEPLRASQVIAIDPKIGIANVAWSGLKTTT